MTHNFDRPIEAGARRSRGYSHSQLSQIIGRRIEPLLNGELAKDDWAGIFSDLTFVYWAGLKSSTARFLKKLEPLESGRLAKNRPGSGLADAYLEGVAAASGRLL
jgi:hypothetical protein